MQSGICWQLHQLFIWDYSKPDEALNPARILRTRRSLRAVHFHPHGGPYILTAEVNDIDSGDSTLTPATSSGYSNCRSAVILANINSMCCHHLESRLSSPFLLWPAYLRDDRIVCPLCNGRDIGSTNVQERLASLAQNLLLTDADNLEISQLISPMDACPGESGVANDDDSVSTSLYAGTEINTVRMESNSRVHSARAANNERFSERDGTQTSYLSSNIPNPEMVPHSIPDGPSGIRMDPFTVSSRLPFMHNLEHVAASSSVPATTGSSSGSIPHYTSHTHQMGSIAGAGSLFLGSQISEAAVCGASLHVGQEVPTSLFEGSGVELPCTVKLRIWRHNIKDPCVALEPGACRLTISHAILCSEMGTHFPPCGRFLVACVACMLPQTEGDSGSQLPVQYDSTEAGTSPTHHPLPSHQVIYELRVYSLEEATFGTVLASRAIRAANCLTSIQFSPTSEHILLAYGRRHNSLLRSIFCGWTDPSSCVHCFGGVQSFRHGACKSSS